MEEQFLIKDDNVNNFLIELSGRLDMQSIPHLWESCLEIQKNNNPKNLIIDAEKVTYCDGAGVALLSVLKEKQIENEANFELKNLHAEFKRLFDATQKKSGDAAEHEELEETLPVSIGHHVFDLAKETKENFIFIGETTYYVFRSLLKPKTLRWKDLWRNMEEVGPNALIIIILVGFLIGLITAFQSAYPLGQFGAQIYIADLVGISLVKELGPLMTAVILAGRTASAFSAEIGTMKVNQEVDALSTMGLNPIRFLVVPRVLATTIMTPILNMFLIIFGLVGCGIVMNALGFSTDIFINELKNAITLGQFIGGTIKAIIFGIMIAGIGCLNGLRTRIGATSVGYSTTRAVVSCIIMMIVIDGIFSYIFYVLGI